MEAPVVRRAHSGDVFQFWRQDDLLGLVGDKTCRAVYRIVPIFAPYTVGCARSGRPGQHCISECQADSVAKGTQQFGGVAENVFSIKHWRWCPRLFEQTVEKRYLLLQPDIFERDCVANLRVGGQHLAWVADQKSVCKYAKPFLFNLR